MKEIPLSRGLFATVDDEDFDWLSQWKWYADLQGSGKFRAVRNAGGRSSRRKLLMHRVILGAEQHTAIDHRNGDALDNRRCNLRACTQAENLLNRGPNLGEKSSKYKGVFRHRDKWSCSFRDMYLGVFFTEIEAAEAYNKAAYNYSPEFAKLNDLEGVVI